MAITVGRFNTQIKQDPDEFEGLVKEIEKISPKVMLEIGILRGGIISFYRGKMKVIGIEMTGDYPEDVVIGDSHKEDTYRKVKTKLGNDLLDVLFIDADHSYEGCRKDYEMYSPLVREGGLIAFHDIIENGWHKEAKEMCNEKIEVWKLWKELKSIYPHKEIVCNDSWAGIGVLYV